MTDAYKLPPLPYAYNALEPHISAQIMELHHSKHHATYVTNLNAALKTLSTLLTDRALPNHLALQQAIRFNGGGHINHSLFWNNLCPASSSDASEPEKTAPKLTSALKERWGSVEGYKEAMGKTLLGIQGSGWGWLVYDEKKCLRIVTTKDQDIVDVGWTPLMGIDMWEHAYYLQYLNGKAAYVKNIWNVINWKTAEERFDGERQDVFQVLKTSML